MRAIGHSPFSKLARKVLSLGLVASGLAGCGAGTITTPAKNDCVGDSITAGVSSWLYPLQDALCSRGCQYKLIGFDARS